MLGLGVDEDEGQEQRRLDKEDADTDGMWEETFDDRPDSKPFSLMERRHGTDFSILESFVWSAGACFLHATQDHRGNDGHHYHKETYCVYNLTHDTMDVG